MKQIILALTILLLTSCGARKVNKDETTENKTQVEVVEQKDSIKEEAKTEVKYNVETCEVEVIPIDSTKEFIVEGKKYFNARIKIKKKKDNTLYTKENKASKTSLKQTKTIVKEDKKQKTKAVDKKEFTTWQFSLLLWAVIILLAIRLYQKFKDRLF
jgi:hypothetical protein